MLQYHVFYHFPCSDGEIAKNVWEIYNPTSLFYKWNHTDVDESLQLLKRINPIDVIVFLDVCPPLKYLHKHRCYIIIDHHQNAIESIKSDVSFPDYKIKMFCDISKSGCMLAWEYLNQNTNYPLLVKYVGNKDIWDFTDENTEPYTVGYTNYISKLKNDVRNLTNKILINDDTYILHNIFIEKGKEMIKTKKLEATIYFNNMKIITETYMNNGAPDEEYKIIDIECTDSSIYKYLAEHAMTFDADVLRILHTIKEDKKVYSVRSLRDDVTVDNIARYHGGNGHPKAAGYTIFL